MAALDPVALTTVEAACRVAGSVGARGRGDLDGAREMLASVADPDDVTRGCLLVAELALAELSRSTGRSLDACVGDLSLRLLTMR